MSESTLLCPCIFYIPTVYNDGRPVEFETSLRIHAAILRQFEAYTRLPNVEGTWRGQTEINEQILIAIPESRIDELKNLVSRIGKELGQIQMYFHAGPPSVSLLDIDGETPALFE